MIDKRKEHYIQMALRTNTSTISDILQKRGIPDRATYGFYHTTCTHALAGFAHTVRTIPNETGSWKRADFDRIFNGIEPGNVLVIANDGAPIASLGDMACLCAKARGALGAVIDGCIRDAEAITEMDWPVYAKGFVPFSTVGKVDLISVEKPVLCSGAKVSEGDFVLSDKSGIVFIPKEIYQEVIEEAIIAESNEDKIRAAILSGVDFSKAFD